MRVAEKPGGVVTFRALRFCSPSSRVRLSEKEVWAAAVLAAEAAWKPGWKGRGPFGQGVPFGPFVDFEELAGGLVGEGGVPGGEDAV